MFLKKTAPKKTARPPSLVSLENQILTYEIRTLPFSFYCRPVFRRVVFPV